MYNKEQAKEYARLYRLTFPERARKSKYRTYRKTFSPTVYAYFDLNGICLYVGKSNHPNTRFWEHKKGSFWWQPNLLLISLSCKDEWESMEYEGKWGGKYKPIHNIDGQHRFKYKMYTDIE